MRRMFDCPASILPDLIYDRDSDFYRLIKFHHHLRIDDTKDIVLENYVKDEPENFWEILERDGVYIHENENFVKDVENSPNLSLQKPTDVFVYDYKDKGEFDKSKSYGSIFLDKDHLSLRPLSRHWKYTLAEFENPSWHEFLAKLYKEPCVLVNSLVLIDRYMFAYEPSERLNYMNGVQNLYDILFETIPGKLDPDVSFQVLIVFNAKTVSNNYSEDEAMQRVGRAVQKMKKKLVKSLKEKYGKDYLISIELLSIDREDGEGIYNETHNRKIISNSFLIKADHSLNAFFLVDRGFNDIETDVHKLRDKIHSQDLNIDFNYDELSNPDAMSFTTGNSDATLRALRHYLQEVKDAGERVCFMKNGRDDVDISELDNRLVVGN